MRSKPSLRDRIDDGLELPPPLEVVQKTGQDQKASWIAWRHPLPLRKQNTVIQTAQGTLSELLYFSLK